MFMSCKWGGGRDREGLTTAVGFWNLMLSEARFLRLEVKLDLEPRKEREPREERGLNFEWPLEARLLPALLLARLLCCLQAWEKVPPIRFQQKHIWVVGNQASYVELLTFVSTIIVTSLSELKQANMYATFLHQGYQLSLHNPQLLYWPTLYIPLMIHTRHSTDSRIGCTAYLRYCWGVANLCHGGNCIHSQTWKKLTNEMWCCVSWISLTCSMNTTEASVCMPCRSSNVFYKSLPSPENGTGVSSGLLPGMIHIDPLTFILWCHFLQCPSEIGSASAERMGQGEVVQGEVGGCTWRV